MKYLQVLQKLYSINRFGMKLGLDNISKLLDKLGNPEKQIPVIHVAGTNGKGSTTTKIASALTYAKKRVGLYTSPHISSFRERIQINGEKIIEAQVATYLEHLFQIASENDIKATFFEYVTALAFAHFRDQKVDFAVFETGLGGRLDATNACVPVLSVITSISYDHTSILGETLEEITKEKAGIIKKNIPVVIGPNVSLDFIETVAKKLSSPIIQVKKCSSSFEEENRMIAKEALDYLAKSIPISQEAISKGQEACPPCRYEKVPNEQLYKKLGGAIPYVTILDVAHNPDGLFRLFSRIREEYNEHPLHVVYGASKDKDIDGCLAIILKEAKNITFVEAESERAQKKEELIKASQKMDPEREFTISSLPQAFQKASVENAVFVICGTFFIMKEARSFLGYDDLQDELAIQEKLQNA